VDEHDCGFSFIVLWLSELGLASSDRSF